MLTIRKKQNIIKEVQKHKTDTGSAEVQIGILSKRIDELAGHLKKHAKDHHSRRGLLQMVSKRRRLLAYLKRNDEKSFVKISKKLNLKISSAS